jgi:hypothetical protein
LRAIAALVEPIGHVLGIDANPGSPDRSSRGCCPSIGLRKSATNDSQKSGVRGPLK